MKGRELPDLLAEGVPRTKMDCREERPRRKEKKRKEGSREKERVLSLLTFYSQLIKHLYI